MAGRNPVLSLLTWVVPGIVVLAVFVHGSAPRAAAQATPAPAAPGQRGAAPVGAGARPARPSLFFSEMWKTTEDAKEHPPDATSLNNQNLEIHLYGAHKTCYSPEENVKPPCVQVAGTGRANQDPINLWNGLAQGPIAATLRDKNNYVDLTGFGRIRWITRSNGFHALRPVVKLADGTAWVADRAESNTMDYLETEFVLANLRWLKLDLDRVITVGAGRGIPMYDQFRPVDLSKVDEVGYADLMPGSGHGAGGWVNLAKFEVYGTPVKR